MAEQTTSDEVEHFRKVPLAAKTLADNRFQKIELSRILTPNGGHSLMAGTWKSPQTISHLLSFYEPKSSTGDGELRRFYTFGEGLNSHPRILHGGVLSTVLDSTMSNASGLALRDAGFTESSVVTVSA